MTRTTTRPDAVDVAAAARQHFAARLRAYREGVARMAKAEDMALPADEAEQLLAVCRDLGIPPDRLAADAVVMLRHSRLTAAVAAVMSKMEAQSSVVAEAKSVMDAASVVFMKVKAEADQRVRVADAAYREAKARHDAASAVRFERMDDKQSEAARLRGESPHLFADDIDAERLRQIVQAVRS